MYDKGWYDFTIDGSYAHADGTNTDVLFKVPTDRNAELLDFQVVVTTTFAGTTPATVDIGHAGDTDAYGHMTLSGAAGAVIIAKAGATANDAVQKTYIPGGTIVLATWTVASGGTPAGAGLLQCFFRMD